MGRKPIIGLNAGYRGATKDGPAFSYVAAGFYDAVVKVGGIPLILPNVDADDDLGALLDLLDGVILVGGPDLDPRRDGFMLHPAINLQDPRRESFDRRLMQTVADRRLPVFGIGSGMQLINVSLGGNLFLHIPEDKPGALPHRDSIDPAHRHGLEVVPGTLMERVYGDGEIRVNSMHHMACDDVAPGLVVTARCPDGVVEAFESDSSDWFVLGTQFHPEAESASALDMRIFDEFLMGVKGEVPEMKLVA